jgi:hypothetical protein
MASEYAILLCSVGLDVTIAQHAGFAMQSLLVCPIIDSYFVFIRRQLNPGLVMRN